MSWLRTHRYLLARRAVQLGILALFWLGARHHVQVLTGNLSSSRVLGTIPLSDPYAVLQILATGHLPATTALLGALLVVLFYLTVGGRAFCAWVCPLNPVSDLARWTKRRLKPSGQFRVARTARFWIMGLALVVSAFTGVAAFEWWSPIALTHRELVFGPGLGLLAVLAILVLDVFVVRNGWCGSLCPLGGFYSLVGSHSLARVGFDSARCDHCGDCVPACPEPQVLRFETMATRGFVDSGDCLNCARCIEVCPRGAYHLGLRLPGGTIRITQDGDQHATS